MTLTLLPTPALLCPLSRWNQLDLAIVLLSIMGITLEEIEMSAALPINPTIIRIMRVLRIARGRHHRGPRGHPDHAPRPQQVASAGDRNVRDRGGPGAQPAERGSDWPGPPPVPNTQLLALVLKLLKMATGMRALLDTVVQALPQVGAQLPRG